MSAQVKRLLVLAVVLVLALSCGPLGTSGTVEPTADTSGEKATAVPGGSPTEDAGGGESEGGDEIAPSDISSSLEGLDSYRMRFTMTYESTDESGATEQGTLEMEVEYVRDPFAQHVAISGGEGVGLEGTVEVVQIGDQQYTVFEDQCIATPVDESSTDMELFKAGDLLSDIESARRVLPDETINGVACRHYTFDEKSMVGFSSAEGEIWVAVDGEYLVKYTLVADGKNPVTKEEGHVEWVYELRDVNAPITIEPPAACESVMESEFPIMPDATDVTMMSGMVSYKSASAFDDVLNFYKDEMVAAGWTYSEDSFVGEDTAMLTYTKEERTATVMLSIEEGKVSVLIATQ